METNSIFNIIVISIPFRIGKSVRREFVDKVELARIRISGLPQPLYRTVKGIQADDINPHDEDDIAIIEIFENELESVYRLLLEEKQEREKNMR